MMLVKKDNQQPSRRPFIQGLALALTLAAIPVFAAVASPDRTLALTGTSNLTGTISTVTEGRSGDTNIIASSTLTSTSISTSDKEMSEKEIAELAEKLRRMLQSASTSPTVTAPAIIEVPPIYVTPFNSATVDVRKIDDNPSSDDAVIQKVPTVEPVRVNAVPQVQVQTQNASETEVRNTTQTQTTPTTPAAAPVLVKPVDNSGKGSLNSGTGSVASPNRGPSEDSGKEEDDGEDSIDDRGLRLTETEQRSAPSESARRIEDVAAVTKDIQKTVADGRQKLAEAIEKHISDLIRKNELLPASATSTEALNAIRERLLNQIDSELADPAAAPERLADLSTKIGQGLAEAERAVSGKEEIGAVSTKSLDDISKEVGDLAAKIEDKAKDLREKGGDLLFKDSNGDGISDYDSVHVYNIDPEKPTPVSVYEGRTIGAEEKVLLGFDPAKEELVRVEKEEPRASLAPITAVHVVNEVRLSEEKKVAFRGQALPNSFVTLYIYSTPVIVTVKTDENGDWSYTLDQELEDGDHTVYVATVSNSGKIVARSSAIPFVKTAEAATIDESFLLEASSSDPGILGSRIAYAIGGIFILVVLIAIALAGRGGSGTDKPLEPQP